MIFSVHHQSITQSQIQRRRQRQTQRQRQRQRQKQRHGGPAQVVEYEQVAVGGGEQPVEELEAGQLIKDGPGWHKVQSVTHLDDLFPLHLDLCIDHLVGSGNPLQPAVDCFRPCCGHNWSILPNFFAKCIFYICDEAAKFVWCGLEGFYPSKTARKVNPRYFSEFTE